MYEGKGGERIRRGRKEEWEKGGERMGRGRERGRRGGERMGRGSRK